MFSVWLLGENLMKRTRRRVLMRTMLKIKKMLVLDLILFVLRLYFFPHFYYLNGLFISLHFRIRLAHGTAIQGLELQGVKVWVVV